MWASTSRQHVIIIGDLNLDRLRPDKREGKTLMDLEDAYDLTCFIDKPTRLTPTTETLIDVLLTNKPETFVSIGILNPGLSDHALIYGIMDMRVKHCSNRIVSMRNCAALNEESFKETYRMHPGK